MSAAVVLVCLARLTLGWATISDNGYDNLVVAISPDVTIHHYNSLIDQAKDHSLDTGGL